MRRLVILAAATLGTFGAAVAGASADTRHVAVGGATTGACTTPATACTPAWALSVAVDGDRVLIAPGTYPLAPNLPAISKDIVVGGDPAQPRPVLLSAGAGPSDWVLWLAGAAGKRPVLQHVDVRQIGSAGYALVAGGATLDTVQDVLVSSTTSTPVVNTTGNALIRDSVVRTGTSSIAIAGHPAGTSLDLRNVTAVGGTIGLSCGTSAFSPALPATITVRNTILGGSTTAIQASGNDASRKCLVLVDHSNFATSSALTNGIVDPSGGGNQTQPPLFADLPAGDLRTTATSPTIDAGVADPLNGATDPDGRPRTLGAAPDIGAYEFAPPVVAPPPGPVTPAAPGADTAPPSITLAGLPRRVSATGLRRGLRLRITTSEPSRVAATLTARRGARGFLAKRKGAPVTVTLGSAKLPAGLGTRTLRLRASARTLGRAQRLRATLTVTATDAAGNTARLVRAVRVAPAPR